MSDRPRTDGDLPAVPSNSSADPRAGPVGNNQDRLRAVVESSPSGLLMTDSTGRIVLVNREIERLFGYAREELLGRSIDDLVPSRFRGAHPGYRTGFLAQPRVRAMGAGRDLFGLRKDGSEVPVEIGLTPVATEDGMFVISSVVDISARKEAENNRHRLESQLLQAQKMEAVGTLAGGIAHDFNNILAAIMGYGELVRAEVPPASRADLDELLAAATRGKQLVQRILTFSRRQEPERRPVDLSRVVRDAIGMLRATISTPIEIEERIHAGGARISADATSVQQVLTNLATNGAHAMPLGGRLEIMVAPDYVRDSKARAHPDLREGHYAVLSVRDSGTGIDPAIRERIFEPFFTTKPAGSGSGLGLAMVHGIMRDHSGAVLVESEIGVGTAVHCYFPALLGEEIEQVVPEIHAPVGAGERVLYVDDEPTLGKIGARCLSALGYVVTAESESLKALESFRARPDDFDLVITDYLMPKLSGLDLARELKRIRGDVRIVLLTGYIEDLPEAELRAAGVRHLARKPLSQAELGTAVRKALDDPDA